MVQDKFFHYSKRLIINNWLIIAIIILASFMRLYKIGDYMEFLGDQGRDVVVVRDFLKNGNLFFIGPQTSIGNMYSGPFYYYLFVVPGLLLTWFNPIGPAIIVALLGILTVYLIFSFSRQWFNPQTAYIASFLYAISPVVIKYSSFSWNPNIMPLFALLFVYFLINSRYIMACLAFIVCINSHFLALLLLPLGLIIFALQYFQNKNKRKILIKQLLVVLVIFSISLTPQILFDIKHQGQNIKSIISFFKYRETTINLKVYKAIPQIVPLFNQINTRLLTGKNVNFGSLFSIIFVLLLINEITKQFRSKKYNPILLIIILWLLISITGLALYKQHIYDHYFVFIYPAVFILFSFLLTRLPKLLTNSLLIVLTILALIENPFRWPAPKQLSTTKQITESIIDEAGNKPFNFALLSKMNYDPGYRYFFTQANAPAKLLKDEISDQLFVACEPFQMDCNPINNPFWDIAAFGWAKVDKSWEINGIKVYKLSHNPSG